MKKGVQLLLDNGTIKITGQRDDYHEVDMVEVCLAEEKSRIKSMPPQMSISPQMRICFPEMTQ